MHSKLFTSEETAMVTFEEFRTFCAAYGLNPYEEAKRIDREAYLKMQIADYIINNNDRHEQNWGFFMDNRTGKFTGFCPLFDHDHAFSTHKNIQSQTTEEPVSLLEAAREAQKELQLDLKKLEKIEQPQFLTDKQWEQVLERKQSLSF